MRFDDKFPSILTPKYLTLSVEKILLQLNLRSQGVKKWKIMV